MKMCLQRQHHLCNNNLFLNNCTGIYVDHLCMVTWLVLNIYKLHCSVNLSQTHEAYVAQSFRPCTGYGYLASVNYFFKKQHRRPKRIDVMIHQNPDRASQKLI